MRCETVVRTTGQQLGVVDDGLVRFWPAQEGGLHAVVQYRARCAAQVFEGLHVATKHRRQVQVHHKLCPQVAAVTEHHGKEPDPALHELTGKVHLEAWYTCRPDLAQVSVSLLQHQQPNTDSTQIRMGDIPARDLVKRLELFHRKDFVSVAMRRCSLAGALSSAYVRACS